MTNQPLFSVLIANYNNGKYLMDAIESVRRQTYANWEIILVDDCSTDNSHALYKELEQDERIHIYLNEKNHGCGYTKRRCAELANGEICGFLDPDDELLQDALFVMVDILTKKSNVSIVFSRSFMCDINMNIFHESRKLVIPKGVSYLENNDHDAEHFVAYRNEAYKKTEGLNPHYQAGVDADLNFLLEEVGDIYVLDKVTYKYRRQKNDSITSNNMKASFYNFMVRLDAYNRRGRNPLLYAQNSYEKCVDLVLYPRLILQEQKIRSTKAYRLGRLILNPFLKLKKLFQR